MKAFILFLFLSAAFITSIAQSGIDSVLAQIERNNPYLSAIRKQFEAEHIGNQTGLYLQNPEFEISYLWKNPTFNGNRTDISLLQTFDFPTSYGHRKDIAGVKNEQLDNVYLKQRQELLLQARMLCIDLIYSNALLREYEARLVRATKIANSYQEKLRVGEINIIEYNRAQLNLLNARKDVETTGIQRSSTLAQLSAMNGGEPVNIGDTAFEPLRIPPDFNLWFTSISSSVPELSWYRKEVELSNLQQQLSKSLVLPKFVAGYKSEQSSYENFQGITFGVAVPLWENKNTVKYAQAHTSALQSLEAQTRQMLYNQLHEKHSTALALQKTIVAYTALLRTSDNMEFLDKSLEKGEISLIDYLIETSMVNESVISLIQMEYELNRTMVVLNQYKN